MTARVAGFLSRGQRLKGKSIPDRGYRARPPNFITYPSPRGGPSAYPGCAEGFCPVGFCPVGWGLKGGSIPGRGYRTSNGGVPRVFVNIPPPGSEQIVPGHHPIGTGFAPLFPARITGCPEAFLSRGLRSKGKSIPDKGYRACPPSFIISPSSRRSVCVPGVCRGFLPRGLRP